MARRADDDQDKALWLTLAQSWVRLAEHVERSASSHYLELEVEGTPWPEGAPAISSAIR
jgi:hypothetical protein